MKVPAASTPRRDPGVRRAWKEALERRSFLPQALATIPVLALTLFFFSRFIDWVEQRSGAVLYDPFVSALTPIDFTWLIFSAIYGALILGVLSLLRRPPELMVALHAYIVMVTLRTLVMFLTPLDPPEGLIPLVDPFVQFFGSGDVPTRDLFFSGHTATLLILAFTARAPWIRMTFLLLALTVGVTILWQHVHYTVDVLTAVPFAYMSYRLVVLVQRRYGILRSERT